jgi:ABC-type nickel/cobalt efflux system permease component RcnA
VHPPRTTINPTQHTVINFIPDRLSSLLLFIPSFLFIVFFCVIQYNGYSLTEFATHLIIVSIAANRKQWKLKAKSFRNKWNWAMVMETPDLLPLISLALGLGMLHALDADHIMAVSALTSTRISFRNSLHFCLRWAAGHGLSLLIIGACVYLLGMAIPHNLSHYAESAVGIMLIVIGAWILWELKRKNAHLHFHRHDNLPDHAHWHKHQHHNRRHDQDPHSHQHGALIVGILHGTAGSAPLLVLIPLSQLGSPSYAIVYLVLFSAGVLLAMLLFGGFIGGVYHWLSKLGTRFVKTLRILIATSSIIFGTYLFTGAFA